MGKMIVLDKGDNFQFTHKSKTYAGAPSGPKINLGSIIHAAKRNDYERNRNINVKFSLKMLKAKNTRECITRREFLK